MKSFYHQYNLNITEWAITESTKNMWTESFPTNASEDTDKIIKVGRKQIVAGPICCQSGGNMGKGFLFICATRRQIHKQILSDKTLHCMDVIMMFVKCDVGNNLL